MNIKWNGIDIKENDTNIKWTEKAKLLKFRYFRVMTALGALGALVMASGAAKWVG